MDLRTVTLVTTKEDLEDSEPLSCDSCILATAFKRHTELNPNDFCITVNLRNLPGYDGPRAMEGDPRLDIFLYDARKPEVCVAQFRGGEEAARYAAEFDELDKHSEYSDTYLEFPVGREFVLTEVPVEE